MGQALYRTEPVFREALDRCAAVIDPLLDTPLIPMMFGDDRVHDTQFAQPALFAYELAMTELWASWGVRLRTPHAMDWKTSRSEWQT